VAHDILVAGKGLGIRVCQSPRGIRAEIRGHEQSDVRI
jgi:hypothetical protein